MMASMLFPLTEMTGQYLETFDVAEQGIGGSCYGPDISTCTGVALEEVTWTLSGNFSGIETEGLITTNGYLLFNDVDEAVCWNSPTLDISSVATSSFTVTFTLPSGTIWDYSTTPGSIDFMDVHYAVDGGAFSAPIANISGCPGSNHTISASSCAFTLDGPLTYTPSVSGIIGNTLNIRVCVDNNSAQEEAQLELVSAPEANTTILPIELTQFSAKPIQNKHIQLNWQTATELNNDYIAIQRSTNGQHFREIGRVGGQGTTEQTHDYQFLDRHPLPGLNYYRLRQVDFNGASTIHRVISVEFNPPNPMDIQIAPNPVEDVLEISVQQELAEAAQFAIFDMNGKVALSTIWPASRRQTIALNNLPTGIYFLRLIAENIVYNRPFVKK